MGNLFELGLWVLALTLLFLANKKRNSSAHSGKTVEVQIEIQKPKFKNPSFAVAVRQDSCKIPLSTLNPQLLTSWPPPLPPVKSFP
jgi:hypothetical protein